MNLIFDLDDTLYLERMHIFQGFLAVARELGEQFGIKASILYVDMLRFLKEGSTRVFDDLKEKHGLDFEPKTLVPIYRESPRRLRLLPDVVPGLARLKTDGHRFALLTNGYKAIQRDKIRELGIKDLFELVLVTDDFGREAWKPSPKLMTHIMEKMGGELSDYLMIGNARDDLEFARQAGIGFLYVQRERRLKEIPNYEGKVFTDLFQLADELSSPA